MSIVTDDFQTVYDTSGKTSRVWSHTCAAGASLLLVRVCTSGGSSFAATYGGQSMTLIAEYGIGTAKVVFFGLVSPPSGANNVSVTWTGTIYGFYASQSFFGVDLSTPWRTGAGANGSSTTPSVSVTAYADDVVLDALTVDRATPSAAAGAGQTEQWDAAIGSTSFRVAGSRENPSSGSSVTMSWTLGSSAVWELYAVALVPDQGDSGFTFLL